MRQGISYDIGTETLAVLADGTVLHAFTGRGHSVNEERHRCLWVADGTYWLPQPEFFRSLSGAPIHHTLALPSR